jgi:predicted porin
LHSLALAAAVAAAGVQAQTSVSLTGIVDAAARQVNNEGKGSMKYLVSGSNSTSRLVVRGVEDLGGGLNASFHLEHGLALDTGNPTGGFWDRRSTVSLASKAWGELRLGRDFVPSYSNWSRFDPFSYVGGAGSNNLASAAPNGPIKNAFGSNPNTTVRSSNAVQWLLPAGLGGLEGGAMVAAGEGGTAANGQHRVLGGRLGWAGKGWVVSAAHTQTENNLTTNGHFTDSVLGGQVAWGPLKLSAAWRQFKQSQAQQRNWLLATAWTLGAGELKASLVRADLSGRVGTVSIDANDGQQLGLGYVHSLSKRTAAYASLSRITNDGAATFVVPGGASGLAGGGASSGFEFGLRHSF